jgi:regulator of sigma E protease
MLELLHTVFAFILAISILVAVHEFGHFWVARRCGVRVLTFSIGFGHALYRRHDKQGTEYIIAAIPLGGYVKMVDEREGPVPEHWLPEAFNRKPVWQRIAIVAAGPIANFLLAFVAFWVLNLGGTYGLAPIIGEVKPGSVAAVAGLEKGQEILAIDGKDTITRAEVSRQLINRLGETGEIHIRTRYADSDFTYDSVLDVQDWLADKMDPDPVEGVGIRFYVPDILPVIGQVVAGGAAEQAGLQVGDRIVRINEATIHFWDDLVSYVKARPDQSMSILIQRGDLEQTLVLRSQPKLTDDGQTIGVIGVGVEPPEWPEEMQRDFRYGFFAAGLKAGSDVIDTSILFVVSIKKLILGQISHKNISGPISIAKISDESLRAGWVSFVTIVAFLSISLGVINLVPIPVLDGGHIFYFLIEAMTGKPVPLKIQEMGFQVGLFLLVGLMLLAFYNDFMRHVF